MVTQTMGDPVFVPTIGSAISDPESGYFFRRIGEIAFTAETLVFDNEVHHAGGPLGRIRRLTVASRYGIVIFADFRGVYIARTRDLIAASERVEEGQELKPTDPTDLCICVLRGDSRLVVLSPDQQWLAVCKDSVIEVFSMPSIARGGRTDPVAAWELPKYTKLKEFAWRAPETSDPFPEGSVLTCEAQLLLGSIGSKLEVVSPGKEIISTIGWSPDGSMAAVGCKDCVKVWHADTGQDFTVKVGSQDEEAEGANLLVDTLFWVNNSSILVGSHLLSKGDEYEERVIAPAAVVRWSSWDPEGEGEPEGLQLDELYGLMIDPDATAMGSGPHLMKASLPDWDIMLYANRKAYDNHINVLEVERSGQPKVIDVTEENASIRIPNLPDDSNNYVAGLGFDLTSTEVEVLDPDPEKGHLKASPVLLVATTDGVLRFFTFSHCQKALTEQIVAAPAEYPLPHSVPGPTVEVIETLPLPDAAPFEEEGQAQQEAAAVSLPDEDDFSDEEEEQYRSSRGLAEEEAGEGEASTGSTPFPQGERAPQPDERAAAGMPLPSSGSEADFEQDNEEGEASDHSQRASASSSGLAESEGSVSSRMASVIARKPGMQRGGRRSPGSEASAESVESHTPRNLGPRGRPPAEPVPRPPRRASPGGSSSSGEEGQSAIRPLPPVKAHKGKKVQGSIPAGLGPLGLPPLSSPAQAFGSPAFSLPSASPFSAPSFTLGTSQQALPSKPGMTGVQPPPRSLFGETGSDKSALPAIGGTGLFGKAPGETPGAPSGGAPSIFGQTPAASAFGKSLSEAPVAPAFGSGSVFQKGSGAVFAPLGASQSAFGSSSASPFTAFGKAAETKAKDEAGAPPAPASTPAGTPGISLGGTKPGPSRLGLGPRAASGALPAHVGAGPAAPSPPPAAPPKVPQKPEKADAQQPPEEDPAARFERDVARMCAMIPRPVPTLTGEAPEVMAMEADILGSIHDVKLLYVRLHHAAKKAEGKDPSAADTLLGYAETKRRMEVVREQADNLLRQVRESKKQFEELQHAWREDRLRAEALLCFQKGIRGGGPSLPLEPALEQLREKLVQEECSIRSRMSDLKKCLDAVEGRRGGLRAVEETPAHHIYNTVNAQGSIIEAQATLLGEMREKLEKLGLGPLLEALPDTAQPGRATLSPLPLPSTTPPSLQLGSAGWRAMRKSPAAGKMEQVSPDAFRARESRPAPSVWSQPQSAELRSLILKKVRSTRGGVRVMRAKGRPTIKEDAQSGASRGAPARTVDSPPMTFSPEAEGLPSPPFAMPPLLPASTAPPAASAVHTSSREAPRGPMINVSAMQAPPKPSLAPALPDPRLQSSGAPPAGKPPATPPKAAPTAAQPSTTLASAPHKTASTAAGTSSTLPSTAVGDGGQAPTKAAAPAGRPTPPAAPVAPALPVQQGKPASTGEGAAGKAGSSAAGKAAAPKKAVLPPMPTMAQMREARKFQAAVMDKGKEVKTSAAPPQPEQKVMTAAGKQASLAKEASAAPGAQPSTAVQAKPGGLSSSPFAYGGGGTAASSPFGLSSAVPSPAVQSSAPAGPTSAFGFSSAATSSPAFGFSSAGASTPAFGFSSLPSSMPAFGVPSAPASAAPPAPGASAAFGSAQQPTPAGPQSPVDASSSGDSTSQGAAPGATGATPASPSPASPFSFGASFALPTVPPASTPSATPLTGFGSFGLERAGSTAIPGKPGSSVFGGFGLSPSAHAPGQAPFGTSSTDFGTSTAAPRPAFGEQSLFGSFGAALPSISATPSVFGGAGGQLGTALGSPAATPQAPSIFGNPAPQSSQPLFGSPQTQSPFGGFGSGASASPGLSAFGQPSATGFGVSSGFGQLASVGFGSAPPTGIPGFGQSASLGLGFGAPAALGSGAPLPPQMSHNAAPFGAAASMGGGFGAFADQTQSGFAAVANQGGGFAAFAQTGTGFGAAPTGPGAGGFGSLWGGQSQGFSSSSAPSNSSMWQMRK